MFKKFSFAEIVVVAVIFAVASFGMATAATVDVTLGDEADNMLVWMMNGYDTTGNAEDCFTAFMKGQCGDFVIDGGDNQTADTIAAGEDGVYTVTVSLETNDGERHYWYNGDIKAAVTDDNEDGECTVAVGDATPAMDDGVCTITITAASSDNWAAADVITLTLSDPDTTGFGGWTADNDTVTVTLED